MGLHKPFDRHLVVVGGNTMTTGRSLNLAKNQLGLFDTTNQTKDGLAAVATLAGQPKNKKYQFKLGSTDLQINRSQSNKASFSVPFSMNDVVDVSVSAPESATQSVDEVVVGYDGVNAGTAITFAKGDRKEIFIRLSGERIGLMGYPNAYVDITYVMEEEVCDPTDSNCTACDDCTAVSCTPIVLNAIEFLKNYQLRGGELVSDMVEITPVTSCTDVPTYTETDYSFYSLSITDLGDENSLSLVQAFYPDYKVTRKSRNGVTSVYEILTTSGASLDTFEQGVASVMKGCSTCPDSYTATQSGYLYAISIEDSGVDISSTIEGLTNAVASSAIKQGQDGPVGFYTVILSAELSAANLTTFLTTTTKITTPGDTADLVGEVRATAQVSLLGEVAALCENTTTTDTDWVEGSTCKVATNDYLITIPDTECGMSRLAELQAAYPDLTIAINTGTTGLSSALITLTGTAGTATLTINSVDYTVTFNGTLANTAADFVNDFADQVFAETGSRLQYVAGTATFIIIDTTANIGTAGFITRTNGADLTITETSTAVYTNIDGGCNTQYKATVITNLVCPECDPIYADTYRSEAPAKFDIYSWTAVAATPAYSTDCLCGIRFKGKKFEVHPDEALRDELGFADSSVKIEVSGGYITEIREAIGPIADATFNIHYLSRWKPRTHLGGNLFQYEDQGNQFFMGEVRSDNDVYRLFKGQQSGLESNKQYVDYTVTVNHNVYSQSFSGKHDEYIKYHFLVEVGRHAAVESLVNLVAGGAGLPGVQAFGV